MAQEEAAAAEPTAEALDPNHYSNWPSVVMAGDTIYFTREFLDSLGMPEHAMLMDQRLHVRVADQATLDAAYASFDFAGCRRRADAAQMERDTQEDLQRLWQAANNYQSNQISGAAIGLLTMSVMQSKPKAIAVRDWINSIWAEYYVRKNRLLAGQPVGTDFSTFGKMPHSVPELLAEAGF